MTLHFLDTSALLKHYHPEVGSEVVDSIFRESDALIISELAIVEFVSGLRRLQNRGEIDQMMIDHAIARFDDDITDDLVVIGLRFDSTKLARELILRHGIRTLDSLQLASVLTIRALSPVFVSADDKLLQAAQANGLTTMNPLTAVHASTTSTDST